jgi:hypothetical protein
MSWTAEMAANLLHLELSWTRALQVACLYSG